VTHPAAAIPPAGGIAAAEAVVVAARALGGSPELMADLISALDVYVGRTPLAPATVAALRGVAAGPEPARAMAVRVLFRNGSRESLRAVLPLFLNRSDPAWGLLASDCPKATGVLVALAADSDPAVARGAGAVLAWVRQNCVTLSAAPDARCNAQHRRRRAAPSAAVVRLLSIALQQFFNGQPEVPGDLAQ
jgi:hypothetical protein